VFLTYLGRASFLRCPTCGDGPATDGFRIREHCPACEYVFVREDGYWLGAMIVNIAVAEAVFLLLFVGGMIATWPDVPWLQLGVVSVGAMIVTPVVFLPWSRTIWVAIDLGILQRLEPSVDEEDRSRRNAT
jgi:uncharacterized protein (DUF983 family)